MFTDQDKRTDANIKAQESRMDAKFDKLQQQITEIKTGSAASVATAAFSSGRGGPSASSAGFMPRSLIISKVTSRTPRKALARFPRGRKDLASEVLR